MMSGIYLFFDPSGLSAEAKTRFQERSRNRVTRTPEKKMAFAESTCITGLAAHHGVMPSGGVAELDSTILFSTGSCWTSPTADRLATPAEILAAWVDMPRESRAAFGGVFALAHYDESRRELIVESDRFAALPIYFRRTGDGVAVSTEIKFLTEDGNETINRGALAEMMGIGYLSRAHTLLDEIERLPAHSRLVCDPAGVRIVPLPEIGYPRNRKVDGDAIAEYDAMVQRSLKRYANLSPEYTISLSGGLDSRLLAVASQRAGIPLHAFSIGEPGSLDAQMAKKVAALLEIPISIHEVRGSGMADWFANMVWFTEGRVLPGHMHYMTANFSGEVPPGPQIHGLIGETHIGGPFDDFSLLGATKDTILQACRTNAKGMIFWPGDSIAGIFKDELAERVLAARSDTINAILDRIGFSGVYSDYLDFRFKFRVEAFTVPCLMSQVLPWSDVVSPFLDTDAFDFGARLEHFELADRAGQITWGLEHMPIIGKLPRVKDGLVVPVGNDDPESFERGYNRLMRDIKIKQLICRLSMGRINLPHLRSFPVYSQWYRKWPPVREYVNSILLSERCLDRGLYRRRGIEKLLHDCRIGRSTWGAIGTILLTEMFFRQFLDGTDIPEDPVLPMGSEF
jgi:hypothetical protein